MQWKSAERVALLALLAGALGIGCAPVLVRLSEVGPSATAFYRLLFAMPILWAAAAFQSDWSPRLGRGSKQPGACVQNSDRASSHRPSVVCAHTLWFCFLAGTFFTFDLAFWHWSIKLTSVANSTLLTNLAPFFVMIGARVWFRERITPLLVTGLVVAALGAAMLVGVSVHMTRQHLAGDSLALVTAGFYGSYLLTVKYLRLHLSAVQVLAWSGLVSCGMLFALAFLSHEPIRIVTSHGFIVLLSLSLISHVLGQGLITYGLAHLPAGFSSVSLLLQPVVAALLARFALAESLTLGQVIGGVIVLLGIGLAGFGRR
jgi:drug/metabolite transporter (DMT)-like permease